MGGERIDIEGFAEFRARYFRRSPAAPWQQEVIERLSVLEPGEQLVVVRPREWGKTEAARIADEVLNEIDRVMKREA